MVTKSLKIQIHEKILIYKLDQKNKVRMKAHQKEQNK